MTEEHPLYALARTLFGTENWKLLEGETDKRMFDMLYRVADAHPEVRTGKYTSTFLKLVQEGRLTTKEMDALYAELVLAGAHRDPETGELWGSAGEET